MLTVKSEEKQKLRHARSPEVPANVISTLNLKLKTIDIAITQ